VVPDTLDLQDDLRYQEIPMKILDTMTKRTRTKTINLCKVQSSHHSEDEAMWEKDALREEYPQLIEEPLNLKDEIPSKWGRSVMP
jgi:hypothetical protein